MLTFLAAENEQQSLLHYVAVEYLGDVPSPFGICTIVEVESGHTYDVDVFDHSAGGLPSSCVDAGLLCIPGRAYVAVVNATAGSNQQVFGDLAMIDHRFPPQSTEAQQ